MTYVPIRGRSFNTYLPCKAWMIYLINRGIMAPLKEKIAEIKQNVVAFMMLFSPTNISEMIAKAKTMTPMEILMTVLSGMFWLLYGFGFFIIRCVALIYKTTISLMKGGEKEVVKKTDEETETKKRAPIGNTVSLNKKPFRVA